jgi:trk system potassium uptake protein TrkA
MRAVVIGAGEVGTNVARTLSSDGHDVTVVDTDPGRCSTCQEELDVLVIEGNGASPRLLRELEISEVDLLAAVTATDEVNVIAALAARQLGAGTTVARVRDPDFFGPDESFAHDVLGIDFVIDPDRATAADIARALLLPGSVAVEYFGDGRLAVAEVIITEDSPVCGVPLGERERPVPAYIVGISRGEKTLLTRPDLVPQPGDHLLVTAPTEHLRAAVAHLAVHVEEVRDCVIFGAGKIGMRLAQVLEGTKVRVTMLERDERRARYVAERLRRTTVLHEEGISREAQKGAGVDVADAFVACAGDDRANLLAALYAKRMGASLCFSVVSREEFTPLVDALPIDAAYSPRLITAEAILRFVHKRAVRGIYLLRSGFEVIELEAEPGSKIAGKALGETHGMLRGLRVGAVLRGEEVLVPPQRIEIQAGDRVLMLGVGGALSETEPFFTGG